MTVWGVSGSDVKNVGWNQVVGYVAVLGCYFVASQVVKIAFSALESKITTENRVRGVHFAGLALGIGVAYIANIYLSSSRFALINIPSTSTLLKLGAVTTLFGWISDRIDKNDKPASLFIGIGVALAGRFTQYGVLGFGAFGAAIGSGLYPLKEPKISKK